MKKISILLLAASALLCACGNPSGKTEDGQRLFIGEDIAVANTQYGRVRGFILDGIYQFRGIPYGESTAGENRFMPPKPPKPWDGVRAALMYGESAPQVVGYNREPESYAGFVDHWNYDLIGEDCLRLNTVIDPCTESAAHSHLGYSGCKSLGIKGICTYDSLV